MIHLLSIVSSHRYTTHQKTSEVNDGANGNLHVEQGAIDNVNNALGLKVDKATQANANGRNTKPTNTSGTNNKATKRQYY
jgi:hypothetical protein